MNPNLLIIRWPGGLAVQLQEYRLDDIVLCRRGLPGVRYNGMARRWEVDDTLAGIELLGEFSRENGVNWTEEATVRRETVMKRVRATMEASQAIEVKDGHGVEMKGLGSTLRPFQSAGVSFMIDKRGILVADPPGSGKGHEALALAQATDSFPCLLVVPASLRLMWAAEVRKVLPTRRGVVLRPGEELKKIEGADVAILSYEAMSKHALALSGARWKWKMIVFDEAHALCSAKARRTKAAIELCQTLRALAGKSEADIQGGWIRLVKQPGDGVGVGAENGGSGGGGGVRVLAMTATPNPNGVSDIVPLLDVIGRREELGAKWDIMHQFGSWREVRVRGGIIRKVEVRMNKAQEAGLHARLRATGILLRRSKAEILPDLPPLQIQEAVLDLDLVGYLRKEAGMAGSGLGPGVVGRKIAVLARLGELRLEAARMKLEAAVEWAEEVGREEKIVLFVVHHEIGDKLGLELMKKGFSVGRIDSEVSMAQRDLVVSRFQNEAHVGLELGGGESVGTTSPVNETLNNGNKKLPFYTARGIDVMICGIKSGGVGLTLTAASQCALVELPWTWASVEQAIGRIHRIGSQAANGGRGIGARIMIAGGTIDEDVWGIIQRKKATGDAIVDGKMPQERMGGEDEVDGDLIQELWKKIQQRHQKKATTPDT